MGKSSVTHSQSGQVLVENILMMVVLVGITMLFIRGMKSSNFLNAMTRGPWTSLKMMAECGHWEGSKGCTHPNLNKRHLTSDPRKL